MMLESSSKNTPELIVALDYSESSAALELITKLKGLPLIFKIGLELFISEGPTFVHQLVQEEHRIFLDLKLHDIPSTVAKAALRAARLGVEMLTVHIAGGNDMFLAIREKFNETQPMAAPKILGVSVLTSFDQGGWEHVQHALLGSERLSQSPTSIASSVDSMVDAAVHWGVDGIVCSPWELATLRSKHPGLYTVVPGIRYNESSSERKKNFKDDQVRVFSPAEAREAGASAIVVGRPITQASDPKSVAQRILKDIGTFSTDPHG